MKLRLISGVTAAVAAIAFMFGLAVMLALGPPASAQGLRCVGVAVTIMGTPGDDVISGTEGRDVIHGLAGNDVIRGLGSNDVICGGGGNDKLYGGNGADRLYGQTGWDRLEGGAGDDGVFGARGNDVLASGSGQDILRGGKGDDRLYGRTGYNQLDGGVGKDLIFRNRGIAIPTVRKVYARPRPVTGNQSFGEPIIEASIGGYGGDYVLTMELVGSDGVSPECSAALVTVGGVQTKFASSAPSVIQLTTGPVKRVRFESAGCDRGPAGYSVKSWTLERVSGWPGVRTPKPAARS